MISALSILLIPVKTGNRVYKCRVRPDLQHDMIRDVLATALPQPHEISCHERLTG